MNRSGTDLHDWRARALHIQREIGKAVVGQENAIRLITAALFARGHVLIEGSVGVGKTTLLRAFARAIGGSYARVEGTVDLMPNELLYHTYIDQDGKPRVEPGPLLRHGEALSVFFFNEMNRARPQVHALLLRVMAERSASAFARDYQFPHLTVFADRNRVEKEETFEISSAARDRFLMEISIETPDDATIQRALMTDPAFHEVDALIARVAPDIVNYKALNAIAATIQNEIQLSESLQDYVYELWQATRNPGGYGVVISGVQISALILAGASPRGISQLLRAARVVAWLKGRHFVAPEDVQDVFFETIAHRVFFNPVYELRRAELAHELLRQILNTVAAP
ncbi:MAG: MoxR family ATPase [Pseudomonadota bacterium]|nr:MoxR family ATPase [Burkholderiales bacterium]MDQ3195003.1 MoxR family ATPase [Pseudomonadota bacterium]